MARILVVDDDPSLREFLAVLLGRAGHEVELAGNVAEYQAQVQGTAPDLIITDFKLGRESGITVLKDARARAPGTEVIIITAFGTPASAVEAMRLGAYDYITKPFDNEELLLLVDRAVEKRQLTLENRALKASLVVPGLSIVGQSARMREVWSVVDKVASTRSTVLILGESGVGKEVVARAIHARGNRAGAPFVAVNCGAIAEGVLESELFGHVRGSFTGATADRAGLLVSAQDGTVFLDEVGELPLGTQVKLLRVLQERTVKPVGSSREVPFTARVLAATNRTLADEVKAGRFREDLFFRLNVISIEVPPLRERPGDIPLLARHFLGQVAHELGRPGLTLSPQALELLERFPFSGNVRQLQNIIERAATLSDGDVLGPDSFPPAVRGETAGMLEAVTLTEHFSLERHLDELERRYLAQALHEAGGVKTRAAELLGLSFRSFRYRLAKHGLGDREP